MKVTVHYTTHVYNRLDHYSNAECRSTGLQLVDVVQMLIPTEHRFFCISLSLSLHIFTPVRVTISFFKPFTGKVPVSCHRTFNFISLPTPSMSFPVMLHNFNCCNVIKQPIHKHTVIQMPTIWASEK